MNPIKNLQNSNLQRINQAEAVEKKSPTETRDEKMLEAAKGFENQFVRQMIAQMRKTVPKDELVDETMADDIYRDQLDNQYADMWVNNGGIGLADMIYQQLQDRYGNNPKPIPKSPGEFLKLGHENKHTHKIDSMTDIFSRVDKNLFLAKRENGGFTMKSREPLPENVGLHSPLAGVVLQSAALEDGREVVVIKHDQGLVSQFVHNGDNRVKNGVRVEAGEIIADLPASKKGELSQLFFGLRKAEKVE